VTRTRDADPVRRAIIEAADRLLAGQAIRSTGRLSISQLAIEAGVARWRLTHQHLDLQEHFRDRARHAEAYISENGPETDNFRKLKSAHAKLLAHCAALEEQVKAYATVIELLSREREADLKGSPVTTLQPRRDRAPRHHR
jgi:hypothetical protein